MPEVQLQQGPQKVFKKTVLFIAPAQDCCMDKVIMEYAPYFMEKGHTVLVTPEQKFQDALQYAPETIVVFRGGTGDFGPTHMKGYLNFLTYMKSFGVRVVYYVDDLIFHLRHGQPLSLAKAADKIVVATPALEKFLRSKGFTQPIDVVLTHMDIPKFDEVVPLPKDPTIKKVILTSTGRVGALQFYQMCEKMNSEPEKYKNVEFHIVAASVAQFRSIINKFRNIKKVYHDWMRVGDLYALIKSCDILISPATAQDVEYLVPPELAQLWLDSKSCVKYNIAGAASIPIIASPTAEYTAAITHGKTGYLANDADEFLKYLDMLLADELLRSSIGLAARDDVSANFNIKVRAPVFIEAITGVGHAASNAKLVYVSSGEGGTNSFSNNIGPAIKHVSRDKWRVTNVNHDGVDTAIILAYMGFEEIRPMKARNPHAKIIHRLDGLPFVSPLVGDIDKTPVGDIQASVMTLMQDINKDADYVIWQSEFAKEVWKPYLDVDAKPNRIIYNGVDKTIFTPRGDKFPLPSKKKLIIHVNFSVYNHKRTDLLYKAITLFPEYDFVLVGNYETLEMGESYKRFAKYPNVTYMGMVKDPKMLASLYRRADALLFTSEMEGCPHVALEALSCGTPVLYNASIDVVPELSMTGTYPWLTMEDLKEVLAGNYVSRETTSAAVAKYSLEEMARQYLEVLESV